MFKTENVNLINLYLTPLAIILVLMAIIFSQPIGIALYGSIALIWLGIINNTLTATLAKKNPLLVKVRMVLNILINVLLVYLLIGFWGPIWYLFLMTPIATAVYSSRLQTFIMSLVMSGLLILVYYAKGVVSPAAWGQAMSRIFLIFFLSLFISALIQQKKITT
jgi:hypothetical protein